MLNRHVDPALPSHAYAFIMRAIASVNRFRERRPYVYLLISVLICIAFAAVGALIAASGVNRTEDNNFEDETYALVEDADMVGDGRIVIISVAEEDVVRFGEWGSDLGVIADAINAVYQHEETSPSAIGICGSRVIDSGTEEGMSKLVDACKKGNVVFACFASLDDDLAVCDEALANHSFIARGYAMPSSRLQEVAAVGHTNVIYDFDGVLRHHLYRVQDTSGLCTLSFATQCFNAYRADQGIADFPRFEVSNDGFFRVSYACAPGGYTRYSLSDVIDGNYPADAFTDKIVMVGPYGPSLSDGFVTSASYSHVMYNVEYQANVVDALLNSRFIVEVPLAIQLLLYMLFTVVTLFVWFRQAPWHVLIESVACFILVYVISAACWANGYAVHPLFYSYSIVLSALIPLFVGFVNVIVRERTTALALNCYVDESIAAEILSDEAARNMVAGKRTEIAIMFADIRGFTSFSENVSAEELVAMLSEYLTLVSDVVYENGGTVDKFIGDCVMAFWGAPKACEDPSYKACKAALEIIDVLGAARVKGQRQASELRELAVGIGIHYGSAIVGNIGSSRRLDFTAVGDVVNTAQRIEQLASAGTILISKEVADRVDGYAETEVFTGDSAVKGKSKPLDVKVLTGLRSKETENKESSIRDFRAGGHRVRD